MEQTTINQTVIAALQRQKEAEELTAIADDIRIVYIWIVFLLGFPGNLFTIVTVFTMRALTPATLYVAILAFCDGLTLVAKLVGHQMVTYNVKFGTIGCKAFFVTSFLSSLGNWVLVLICAERCVSVCFPLRRHLIITKRRAYISTLALTIILLVIFSVMYGLMRDVATDGTDCGTDDRYYDFWTTGWYWINSSIHLFIPLPIIVILTVVIIRGFRQSRRDRREIVHNGNSAGGGNHSNHNARLLKETERLERNISVMLILVVIVLTVLSLPACIYVLTYESSDDSLTEARWKLFDQIQYVCIDSSHAVNFFLYFLSAKKFREQFIFLITCHRWPQALRKAKRRNRVNHSTTCTTKHTILMRSTEELTKLKTSNNDLHSDH